MRRWASPRSAHRPDRTPDQGVAGAEPAPAQRLDTWRILDPYTRHSRPSRM